MSIYDEVSASNSEDRNYPYHSYIKPPDKLGVSSKGNFTALGNDINALTSYVGVLVSGKSKAQDVSRLGNKYFMSTGATCTAPDGSQQPRFVYVNNVPDGAIPLLSSSTGVNMNDYRGLVPGVLEDLSYINPLKLFSAFSTNSACQEIEMKTRDIKNATSVESKYVLESDIRDYNPCWFKSKRNPVTNVNCVEAMTIDSPALRDPAVRIYLACAGFIGVYITLHLITKRSKYK
jgi:hypothetical protein